MEVEIMLRTGWTQEQLENTPALTINRIWTRLMAENQAEKIRSQQQGASNGNSQVRYTTHS